MAFGDSGGVFELCADPTAVAGTETVLIINCHRSFPAVGEARDEPKENDFPEPAVGRALFEYNVK